ncbi:MAG TPA: RDD family protein [Acidimicrobiales bacterium]
MSTVIPRRSTRYTPPASPTGGRPGRRGGNGSRDHEPDPRPAPGLGGARRLAAAAVDALLVPAVVLGAAEVAWSSGALRLAGVGPAGWNAWSRSYLLVAWTVTAVAAAYHGVCIAAGRRTPGKALAGLVVVTDDGRSPGPVVALWRAAWSAVIYAPVVLAPVMAVVAAGLSLTGAHRSLADRAAGTRVVRAPAAGP